jgi:AraC-like DNA-binding protein
MFKMSGLYTNTAVLIGSLVIATLLAGYLCYEQTFWAHPLLPTAKSFIPWTVSATTDSEQNGRSTARIDDATQGLNYTFTLSPNVDYSFASVGMFFTSEAKPGNFIDFSKYRLLRFRAKCSPHNVLSFTIHSFDPRVTDIKDVMSYRIPMSFFSCNQIWQWVEIDLRDMEIPEWWLQSHKINLADRGYQLNQVYSFSFGTSVQSPRDTLSYVNIADIELAGSDWRFIYGYAVFVTILWLVYGFWYFRKRSTALISELQKQIQKGRPLIAYQQLSVEPHRDKEKNAVLRYMATEYANPDLSVEIAISAIGINRAKINNILKEEIGLTFSAYLNKLRLTEAARLLMEKPGANVAEIAFSVGYNNVSYFNKLFKQEYGCPPKTFKPVYSQKIELNHPQEYGERAPTHS